MPIIYEVNLSVDENILEPFLQWLDTHIQQMLEIDGFNSAKLLKDIDNKNSFCVQYMLESKEHLDNYFNNQAKLMREDGLKRFPNQFQATRRILSLNKRY